MSEIISNNTLTNFHQDINILIPYFTAGYYEILKGYKNICLTVVFSNGHSRFLHETLSKFNYETIQHIIFNSVDFKEHIYDMIFACFQNFEQYQTSRLMDIILSKYRNAIKFDKFWNGRVKMFGTYALPITGSKFTDFIEFFLNEGYDGTFLLQLYNMHYNHELRQLLIKHNIYDPSIEKNDKNKVCCFIS